jgi:hypothetical protein
MGTNVDRTFRGDPVADFPLLLLYAHTASLSAPTVNAISSKANGDFPFDMLDVLKS